MNKHRPIPRTTTRRAAPMWLAAPALAAALVLLAGCNDANGKTNDSKDEPAAVPVEVARPSRGDIVAVYSGTAPVEAAREAHVVAKVGGEVRQLLAEEGTRVRAGQVLARLDGDRLRLEAAQAEANLRKTERDYARNVELQKKGLVSTTAFDNLKYDLEALRATYDMARLNLSYTEIRAPIDGVVAERRIKVGNTVTPNQELFNVTDPDPLVLYVHVPERELRKLSVGQPADIQVDAVPGTRFVGRITIISPVVDPETATFRTKLEVSDPTGQLRPGMFARVNIAYERRSGALQIPRGALVDSEGEPSVFVITAGKAEPRRIRTGLANGGLIEVVAGLKGDEQVVVVGQGALKQGTAVRIVSGAAPAAPPARTASAG